MTVEVKLISLCRIWCSTAAGSDHHESAIILVKNSGDGFAGVRMASLGSDLVFGFQQVLFDLIILFFEGLGILDHFLGFLDQVGGTVWVTEPKAL